LDCIILNKLSIVNHKYGLRNSDSEQKNRISSAIWLQKRAFTHNTIMDIRGIAFRSANIAGKYAKFK